MHDDTVAQVKTRPFVDRLGIAMRASHILVLLFVVGGVIFAAIGTAMGDTFFLRLATEALIFLRSRSIFCSAIPACCRWVRHCILVLAPTSPPWC